MTELDLIVKNGKVVTASDKYDADVGVKDGTSMSMCISNSRFQVLSQLMISRMVRRLLHAVV